MRHYTHLPQPRIFEIVERREKPDFFLRDTATDEFFGVELTSVYLTDRSVPDEHISPIPVHLTTLGIPHNDAEITQYKARLVQAVADKVAKAQHGYDLRYPLILSIYVNEYRAIFLDTPSHWEQFVHDNNVLFDRCHPFSEIVFWSLPNDMVLSVRPS